MDQMLGPHFILSPFCLLDIPEEQQEFNITEHLLMKWNEDTICNMFA